MQTASRATQKSATAKSAKAWHVGRHGEVAGGMTQVVNGYLAWQFDRMEVGVIASRDGSKGARALRVFAGALKQIWAMRDPQRNMLIVHLSQGGSFIREGALLWLARKRGFGTVAHIHGSSFVDFAGRHPRLVRFVLAQAGKVVVLSDATRTAVTRLLPNTPVELVPNAVPAGSGARKEKLVVFGGGVTRRKGVDVLVEAWRRVGCSRGWQLAIAGPVIDDDVVPADLPDAKFLGAVPHKELMALLDRSAIAVLPSRDEAMPMFILEAMARDNCVISTHVGGIPAVLADGRGMLVAPGDIEQLASALDVAITDDARREAIAAAGRAAFDRGYSAEAIYPRMESLWLGVLSGECKQ